MSNGVPTRLAIKGSGRPTRLLPHAKMLLIAYSNKVVFICWVDSALEGSAFILSKCDLRGHDTCRLTVVIVFWLAGFAL